MKFGMRKPSLRKSISARTTGRAKRAIKRDIILRLWQERHGVVNPKRAIYNRVYRRTTFSIFDLVKVASRKSVASNNGCCVTIFFWWGNYNFVY